MTKQLRRIQFALLLPLSTKNELIGFVSLGARLGDLPYSANDEQLLMSVAGQITLALENARLIEGDVYNHLSEGIALRFVFGLS